MIAFMFPGQGSQKIGMGKELYDNFSSAKEVFEEVNDCLSFSLTNLMFEGNIQDLSLTNNAQPSIMAVSLATIKVLEKEFGFNLRKKVSFTAGHSLGEYSALCASSSLSISDTAKVLRARGQAMLDASPVGVGAMAAILGQSEEKVQNLINLSKPDGKICVIANYNVDGQIVISGHAEAIEKACILAKENKIKAIKLPVSGAFHSPLMLEAEKKLADVLSNIEIKHPEINFIPNVLARTLDQTDDIKNLLIKQVTGSVLWKQTLDFLSLSGVNTFVEVGCGTVLTNLVKKANNSAKKINLDSIIDIERFVEECL